ncbi:MAG: flagellar biosynthesis protein FlhB [Dehalococcoidia bacterium]|nr:flagellar biosynthesis protein FlhB [Dehalococcoidia bacterium]
MAGEKTEAPTPRRMDDARKRGQVARSREVDSAIVILATLLVFRFSGGGMWASLEALAIDAWRRPGDEVLSTDLAGVIGVQIVIRILLVLAPLIGAITFFSVLGGMAQTGGPLFSKDALKPKLNRMDPLKGGKRLIASRQAYVNLVKSLAKFGILGGVAVLIFKHRWDDITSAGMQAGLTPAVAMLIDVAFDLMLWTAVVLIVMAAADYLFQKQDLARSLRMSRQEVQDEMKQSDGDPQMKAQMARARRQLLQRIMKSVPKADVVLMNPTHYAVALRYDPATSPAPIVVAKGMNLVALRIREIAEENGVTVITNPPLARALYKATRVGQEIPADLYEAVAEILAFVYRLRTSRFGRRAVA